MIFLVGEAEYFDQELDRQLTQTRAFGVGRWIEVRPSVGVSCQAIGSAVTEVSPPLNVGRPLFLKSRLMSARLLAPEERVLGSPFMLT